MMSDKKKNILQIQKIYIPSFPESSVGPGPTTSDTASCSGSLSCSDLKT